MSPPPSRSDLRQLTAAERSVPKMLLRGERIWGERRLVAVGEESRTYAEAARVAAEVAGSLRRAGIGRGDRVATLCSNRIELVDTILACAWIGAVAVPLNVSLRGNQLRHALTDSGAALLLIDGQLAGVLDALELPAAPPRIWTVGEAPPDGVAVAHEPLPERAAAVEPVDAAPAELAAVIYTSGTTGPSKGVCVPHAQLYWWGAGAVDLLELRSDDVLFSTLPLFHINALCTVFQALVTGSSCVFAERFSASGFWRQAREADATVTFLLGAMVSILSGREPGSGDRDHRIRVALSPATPAALCESFKDRFGVQLVEGYGSTETNCAIGAQPDEQRPGMIGYVRPGFEARVADELDREVAADQPGELLLRAREPWAFSTGYFGLPGKTAEAWRNLWFHTGDQVTRDAEGWFRFVDRDKDRIRRRGENVSSFEVEEALLEHDSVAAVAAFGVPSELGEDEVMAAVVLKAGREPDPGALIAHCESRLAYFAIPRYLDFPAALPLTESGKVRKQELREGGVGPITWDREAAGHKVARR